MPSNEMSEQQQCRHEDIIREDWYRVCTDCGLIWEPPFFDRPQALRQNRTRNTVSKYSRVSNLELHLKQLKGQVKIPDEVFETLINLKKDFQNQIVSYKTVKAYLKLKKLNKLYPLIPTLMKKFWGIETLQIGASEEKELILKFIHFERAFEKAEKGDRKNSISYEYLIRKFLEEAGNQSYLNIPTLSDRKKLQEVSTLYSQVAQSSY